MKDIIEETQKEYKEIVLRDATGTVGEQSISLRLIFNEQFPKNHWVSVYENYVNVEYNNRLDAECFSTHFFANRYFNKLIRKYSLIEKLKG